MIHKKKQRNPIDDNIIMHLSYAIYAGSPWELVNAIVYYKQKKYCDDCERYYENCECEKCNNCGFNRCLCDLNINDTYTFSKLEGKEEIIQRKRVAKEAITFAKNILNKKELLQLTDEIKKLDNNLQNETYEWNNRY